MGEHAHEESGQENMSGDEEENNHLTYPPVDIETDPSQEFSRSSEVMKDVHNN